MGWEYSHFFISNKQGIIDWTIIPCNKQGIIDWTIIPCNKQANYFGYLPKNGTTPFAPSLI